MKFADAVEFLSREIRNTPVTKEAYLLQCVEALVTIGTKETLGSLLAVSSSLKYSYTVRTVAIAGMEKITW